MSGGWYRVHRKMLKHPLVGMKHPERFTAWNWMLAEAAHAAFQIEIKGKVITLQRGQFCHSIRHLAETWAWSRGAVERFLTRLKTGTEGEPMIETETETGQLIITICNYERYQGDGDKTETPTGTVTETPTETRAGQERDNKEEGKEGKEGLKPPKAPHGAFDDFWQAYPAKVEKKGARRKFEAAVKAGTPPQQIIEAAERYAASEQVRRGFIKHPTTWLNNGCWDDEPEQAKGMKDGFLADAIRDAERSSGWSENEPGDVDGQGYGDLRRLPSNPEGRGRSPTGFGGMAGLVSPPASGGNTPRLVVLAGPTDMGAEGQRDIGFGEQLHSSACVGGGRGE